MSAAIECKAKSGEDLFQFFFSIDKTHGLCDVQLFLFSCTVAKLTLSIIQTTY